MKKIPVYLLPLLLVIPLLSGCREGSLYRYSRMQMGTLVNLTLICGSDTQALHAAEAAFGAIEEVERLMSPARRESDISRLNLHGHEKPVKVSAPTFGLIRDSLKVSVETEGAFDISFAGMGKLWDYRNPSFTPPDKALVRQRVSLVDYRHIILSATDNTVRFARPGMRIGLGGIAKGYALSRAAAALEKQGVRAFIVDAGGDLTVKGARFGKKWRVGIKHPRKEGISGALTLEDSESIVTSGDYERFVMHRGVRYHHIIDPKTGYPARTFASVSVIGSDPTLIDAYATALFVMGGVRAREFLKKHTELKVILIDLEMKVYASRELKEQLEWLEKADIEWL